MLLLKKILPVLLCCLLTSCAATIPRQLSYADKSNIKSSKIIVNSTQREIVIEHNNPFSDELPDPYAPMDSGAIVQHNQGCNPSAGLVGVIVVGCMQYANAKSVSGPLADIRNSINDFDYMTYFNKMIKQNVSTLPWLKVKNQQVEFNIHDSEEQLVAEAKENTILLVGTTYALNSSYKQLKVFAYVKLLRKCNQNQPSAFFENTFNYTYRLPQISSNSSVNKLAWTQNHGELLKEQLKRAASSLSKQIAMGLNKTN